MISRSVLVALLIANIGVGAYFGLFADPGNENVLVAQHEESQTDSNSGGPQQDEGMGQSPAIAQVTTKPEFPDPVFEIEETLRVDADKPAELQENDFDGLDAIAAQTQPRECRVWGPVSSPDEFDDLSRNLEAVGGFPEIKEIEVVLAADYLVFVGPVPNMSQARQIAGDLRELQIDNYVINRENTGPGVSVGVFSRESLAQRQLEKVAQLGYEVSLEPMQRSQKAYNLHAHVERDSVHFSSSISGCMDIAQNP